MTQVWVQAENLKIFKGDVQYEPVKDLKRLNTGSAVSNPSGDISVSQ
jgi:hypothetical protein